MVDFKGVDYRSFIFVVHEQHGLMLLHCTRKPKKGPHFQLPGGHIDNFEFARAAKVQPGDRNEQLKHAGKMGASRELWEETGIDVRHQLHRLQPAALKADDGTTELNCQLKRRLFFFLAVRDDDFLFSAATTDRLIGPLRTPSGTIDDVKHLKLRIGVEHSGFTFEGDPKKAAELLKKHSGGVPSKALTLAMVRDKQNHSRQKKNSNTKEIASKTAQEINQAEGQDVPVLLGERSQDPFPRLQCFRSCC